MAKFVSDQAMDQELLYIEQCDVIAVCTDQPATWAQMVTTYMSASAGMTAGSAAGSGSYITADGTTNGRKVTVAAKSAIPIKNSGSATHVALGSSTGSTVRLVTTCTSQYLTAGGTVDVPTFALEIADPT